MQSISTNKPHYLLVFPVFAGALLISFSIGCATKNDILAEQDHESDLRRLSRLSGLFIPDDSKCVGYYNLFDNDEAIQTRLIISKDDYRFFENSLPSDLVSTKGSPTEVLYDDEALDSNGWWKPSLLVNPRGKEMNIDSSKTIKVLVGDDEATGGFDVYIYLIRN